jgi:hypothetical protein
MGAERVIVRLGIPVLLVGSCAGAVGVSLHANPSEIPSFAFGSHVVLAVQIALLLFYGALLLLVPLVRALFDGDLPVELSLRGARWKERMFEVGDELLTRQVEVEDEALRVDIGVHEQVRLLREELTEADETLEGIADQMLARIVALEEKVENRASQRYDRDSGRRRGQDGG